MKVLSAQNLYAMKHTFFQFDGQWKEMLGEQPTCGSWLVYGPEKHGKTSFTLSLIKYLSNFKKVLYVSGEEGTDKLFIDTLLRAGIGPSNRIGFLPYVPIPELNTVLKKRKSADIIVIDNMTIYMDEFKRNGIMDFIRMHPNKLIIFISHEERKEPSTSAGRYVKKIAKIIVRIEGLVAQIGGRCPGGQVLIHEEAADLFGIILNN